MNTTELIERVESCGTCMQLIKNTINRAENAKVTKITLLVPPYVPFSKKTLTNSFQCMVRMIYPVFWWHDDEDIIIPRTILHPNFRTEYDLLVSVSPYGTFDKTHKVSEKITESSPLISKICDAWIVHAQKYLDLAYLLPSTAMKNYLISVTCAAHATTRTGDALMSRFTAAVADRNRVRRLVGTDKIEVIDKICAMNVNR